MQAILGVDLLLTATPKLEKGNKRRSKKRDMFYVKLKEPRQKISGNRILGFTRVRNEQCKQCKCRFSPDKIDIWHILV